ncbi:MAG: class II D-tagatose-bisphosphate aldolase, non-catalytic subunit [Desulfosarcinaceae bacterium]
MLSDLTQLRSRHLEDKAGGMVSICSVHAKVIEAAMASHHGRALLIEVTPNQVNPEGGYSGLTPMDFARHLYRLAERNGFSTDRLILGADHLGPHVWRHLDAQTALARTEEMVRQCVAAGFRKIHLDTAVPCADDDSPVLLPVTAARRAARLCLAAENSAARRDPGDGPVYVIGQDVPRPGGGLDARGEALPTSPEELARTLDIYAEIFASAGLRSAWKRVVAVVVQPGVDFNDYRAAPYRPERAADLSACYSRLPGVMTFEAHATDYQTADALKQMVRDHFNLLKVGPCLTYAFREAVYALARIEAAWSGLKHKSNLAEVMDALMLADPRHLPPEQRGESDEARQLRQTSLRDRIRYYWSHPRAKACLNQLLHSLDRPIPPDLVKEFLPGLDPGANLETPNAIILGHIQKALQPYIDACHSQAASLQGPGR